MSEPLLLLGNERILETSGSGARRRLGAIWEALADLEQPRRILPSPAPREALARVHTPAYLERLESLRGLMPQVYEHRSILPGSMASIRLAAGAALGAVEAVWRGEARAAFSLVEPPGHHAEPDWGTGFCAINNAAVAVAHAIAELGCRRALVVDWDVHHGNGTQKIFWERDDVLLFDCHQADLFPERSGGASETGAGPGRGHTVNVPLPPGCGDADYAFAFSELLIPLAESFRPELVVVSAGFDAHHGDPLGRMKVTEQGFAHLCSVVRALAERHAGGRLALVLEGGYDAPSLARSVRACVEVLLGGRAEPVGGAPSDECVAAVEAARAAHQDARKAGRAA